MVPCSRHRIVTGDKVSEFETEVFSSVGLSTGPRNCPMVGLVTFDVEKEEYDYISCPTSSRVMVELGNRLGVADISPEGLVDIWELDIHTEGWAKKYEVDFLLLANLPCPPSRFLERHHLEGLGMWNEKIVFKFESALYSYDPQSRSIEPIQDSIPIPCPIA